jgi:uncharacterized protein (TIGR00159 family)
MLFTFLKAVGIADLFDIALVGVLVYALLVWFKRAKAAFVAKGMLVVTAVYMLASASGMVMTTSIFHALFAILLVALVVIFQEELRTTFERIAVWSLSGGKTPIAGLEDSDALAQTLWDLSRERIGALVVLRGQDPLDRHLEGGWKLGGAFSEALLRSIFDDHSIGHDGAVIIEGGEIVHFGCRLPLSKEFVKTARLGTRHTAALGLSELTDATCIVVSEERGSISVAQEGRLETLRKLSDLQKKLQGLTTQAPSAPSETFQAFLKKNSREKVVAFSASLLLWALFVLGVKSSERIFEVPVTLRNVPVELKVANTEELKVRLTYRGQMRYFYLVREGHISIVLDMSRAHLGSNRMRLTEGEITRPAGIRLEEVAPLSLDVSLVNKDSSKKVSLWR